MMMIKKQGLCHHTKNYHTPSQLTFQPSTMKIMKYNHRPKTCPYFLSLLLFFLTYNSHFHPSSSSSSSFFVSASWSIILPSGERKCVMIRTPINEQSIISGEYAILDEDDVPSHSSLHVSITSEELDQIVYDSYTSNSNNNNSRRQQQQQRQQQGEFRLVETKGRYELCFGNGVLSPKTRYLHMVTGEHPHRDNIKRRIGFALHVIPMYDPNDQDGGPSTGMMYGPMTESYSSSVDRSKLIHENLAKLVDHIEFVKEKEVLHRDMVEGILRLIKKWNMVEIFVLTCIAVVQVLYLRKYFERSKI